jgi:hypothetical protein
MMNNETGQFENRLRRQPMRKIPGEWRGKILVACRGSRVESRAQESRWISTLAFRLSTVLWPHPKAWAGLAAIWILIFAVNFSVRDTSPGIAEKSAPLSPEAIVELKKQQLLFAELMGSRGTPDVDRQKISPTKPRSERTEILMT